MNHFFLLELYQLIQYCRSGPGGTQMCCPNGLLFHQKSVDMGPILVKKILRGGPISQNFQQKKKKIDKIKSAIFEVENPLGMGLDLRKFQEKNCLFSHFLSEKNPYIWMGVSDLGLHTPSKNNLSSPPSPDQGFSILGVWVKSRAKSGWLTIYDWPLVSFEMCRNYYLILLRICRFVAPFLHLFWAVLAFHGLSRNTF